jgi:cleavage and polyadenylation specificity factor subunit 2
LQFEDSEIGFVKGRITIPPHTGVPLLEPLRLTGRQTNGNEGEDNRLVVESLKPKKASLPRAMMVGDLKLTALKSRLNELDIAAEFAGEGVLVCRATTDGVEDIVAVRKTGRGEVRVEGGACEMFYTVRDAIYQLHALVEV